jgi:hypothetical protein
MEGFMIKKPSTTKKSKKVNSAAVKESLKRQVRSRTDQEQQAVEARKVRQIQKSGKKRIQGHAAAATRRKQAKRDTQNS